MKYRDPNQATYNPGNNYGGSLNTSNGIHLDSVGLSEPTRAPRAGAQAMTGGDWQQNRKNYLGSIGAGAGYSLNPRPTSTPRAPLDSQWAASNQAAVAAQAKNHMPLAAIGGRNNVYAPGMYSSGQGQQTIVAGPGSTFSGSAVGGGFNLSRPAAVSPNEAAFASEGFGNPSRVSLMGSTYNGAGGGGATYNAGNAYGGSLNGANGVHLDAAGGGYNSPGNVIGRNLERDNAAANAANKAINDKRQQDWYGGQVAQQGALDANYGAVYGTLNDVLGQQQALTGNYGSTAHEQERRRLVQQQGATSQRLIGRGLGNSTITEAMARGNATDSAFVQNGIDEGVNREKVALLGAYGQQMAGAQTDYARAETQAQQYGQSGRDRISDDLVVQGPNPSDYYSLLQKAGARGGAGAAGATGTGGQDDGTAMLEAYMRSHGGAGGQAAGGNPWVDQQTIINNQKIRDTENAAKQRTQNNQIFDDYGFGQPGDKKAYNAGGGGAGAANAVATDLTNEVGGSTGRGNSTGTPPIEYSDMKYDESTGQMLKWDYVSGTWYVM